MYCMPTIYPFPKNWVLRVPGPAHNFIYLVSLEIAEGPSHEVDKCLENGVFFFEKNYAKFEI